MKRKSLDLSRFIIYAALVITAARYAGAFLASDLGTVTGVLSEIITGFMVVSGIGMGVLDVIGLGYIADSWRSALPRAGRKPGLRFIIITGFLLALFISGIGILTPFTVSRVNGSSIALALPGRELYFWAVLVNAAPYLIVAGIMVSTSGILTIDTAGDAADMRASESHNTRIEKPALERCALCGETYRSKAAHIRWRHPEAIAARVKSNGNIKEPV